MHPTQALDLLVIPDRDLTESEALTLTEQYESAEQAQGYIVHLLAKGNGYKALGYATIEEWGAERFLLSRSQMERLIVHGRVIAILICRPVGDIGTRYPNERQARALTGLLDEPAELCRAWDLAVADGTSRVTAALVATAVAQVRPSLAKVAKEPKAPKQSTSDELELARLRKMEAEEMQRRIDQIAAAEDALIAEESEGNDSPGDVKETGSAAADEDPKGEPPDGEEVQVRAQTSAEQAETVADELEPFAQRLTVFHEDMTDVRRSEVAATLVRLLDLYAPDVLVKNAPKAETPKPDKPTRTKAAAKKAAPKADPSTDPGKRAVVFIPKAGKK